MALPNIAGELSYYMDVSKPGYHFDIKKHYPKMETVTSINVNNIDQVIDDIFITYIECRSEKMEASEPLIYPNYMYKQWFGSRYHCIYFKYKDDCVIMIFDGFSADNKVNMVGVINGYFHVVANNTHFTTSSDGYTLNINDFDAISILTLCKQLSVKFLFHMASDNDMNNHP